MTELEAKVFSLIEAGKTPIAISEELDIKYSKVTSLKKRFEQAALTGELMEMVDDVEKTTATEKEILEKLNIESKDLIKGVAGLELLQSELQLSALYLNARARELVVQAETLGELGLFTDIMCQINKAFFDKQQVNMNVQNNFGEQGSKPAAYNQFLGDKPGA